MGRVRIPRTAAKATIEATGRRVFARSEIVQLLKENEQIAPLIRAMGEEDFVRAVARAIPLKRVELASSKYSAAERYVLGEASLYEIGISLRPRAFLSHGTALFLLGLTDQLPKAIYVNHEQTPKGQRAGGLIQASLDRAFGGGGVHV